MWRKGESEGAAIERPSPTAAPAPKDRPEARRAAAGGERATIGPSIFIRGDVTGEEDLFIEGRVDGTVDLKQYCVTVGEEGRVKASLSGRRVTIEGEVTGDLHGEEQIVLRRTARVEGNIVAPSVTLEDGAQFRGNIDMPVEPVKGAAQAAPAAKSAAPGGPGAARPPAEVRAAAAREGSKEAGDKG
jgi:cytoskeletal protein CcmA (bactofilin family)